MIPIYDGGKGPCAKKTVVATVIAATGERFVATNHCDNPQDVCPRGDMPTGVGYELCKSICQQRAHAERNAVDLAGDKARGAILLLEGHTYACDDCIQYAKSAGIDEIYIVKGAL